MKTQSGYLLSILLLCGWSSGAGAQLFDGGEHYIISSNTTQQVYVEHATSIEVVDGAELMPTEPLAALMVLDGSTVVLRSAFLQGGANTNSSSGYTFLAETSYV